MIEKQDTRNIFVVENIFSQGETKRTWMNVNIDYNSRRIIILRYVLRKCNLVRVVWNSYQYILFFIC